VDKGSSSVAVIFSCDMIRLSVLDIWIIVMLVEGWYVEERVCELQRKLYILLIESLET
jgi:hypothetical protein